MLALRLGASLNGAVWAGLTFVFGTVALVDARDVLAAPTVGPFYGRALYFTLSEPNKVELGK